MSARTAAVGNAPWMAQCMRDVKAQKITQVIRTHPGSGGGRSSGQQQGSTMPVRSLVATATIHRGEHIGTVKRECVLTGGTATQLLQQVCARSPSHSTAAAPTESSLLAPVSAQSFDRLAQRLSRLPLSSAAAPHLLLSRDALLMTVALYVCRSRLHHGVVHPQHPLLRWAAALPRRRPPLAVLLRRSLAPENTFEPLQRRLRLGRHTRDVAAGEGVAEASTELMVQAVESGDVALADLQHPSVETALTATVLTNYFKGSHTPLTPRQHATQRARSGAAEREDDAMSLLRSLEQQLQAQLTDALLPELLQPSLAAGVADTPEWQAEAAAMQWAHFMVRSRAVNLNWRREGLPQLSVVPFLDMLNHSGSGGRANVVYHREDDGDVSVTASETVHAGEELVLSYGHVGQRGCLFGDAPPETRSGHNSAAAGSHRAAPSRHGAATAREVERIEKRQYSDTYAVDDDDAAAAASVHSPTCAAMPHVASPSAAVVTRTNSQREREAALLAHRETQQEVQWLWRYGFLRSAEERNMEAAQLWSRGLRSRIAHLTDVRRKGRAGEFVIGVPEGLQRLREQRAQLERDRYANHRVFPPQQS